MPRANSGELPSVLLIHNRYRIPGGEDVVFAAERDLLERHGHRVLTYERSNTEATSLLAKLLMPLSALWSLSAYREVRALIRREKPDIVHIHNTLLRLSPSVFWAAKAEGVPVVMTLHNFRLLCPNGILMRSGQLCEDCPQQGLFCAVKHSCYRGSKTQSLIVAAMLGLHRALGTWRGVWAIAPTDFDRQKFLQYNEKYKILSPEKLVVKPHPVAPDEAAPMLFSARKNWLFAGRLEELKGIRTLLAAWQKLPGEHLVIAGDGPLEAECRAYAKEHGLNAEFLGRVSHDTLSCLQRSAKGVIVPSLCYESFGLSAAESLSHGTPVVGSDLGNTGAFITPGENGVRFAAGNADALADAVQQLNTLLPTLSPESIQAKAAAQFAPEQSYQTLLQLYRRALQADETKENS